MIKTAQIIAEETGANITVTEYAQAAVRGCDFLYTDVWVSMDSPPICGASVSSKCCPTR